MEGERKERALRPEEALEHIAYMRQLVDQTRLRAAGWSRGLFVTGLLWIFASVGPALLGRRLSPVLVPLLFPLALGFAQAAMRGWRNWWKDVLAWGAIGASGYAAGLVLNTRYAWLFSLFAGVAYFQARDRRWRREDAAPRQPRAQRAALPNPLGKNLGRISGILLAIGFLQGLLLIEDGDRLLAYLPVVFGTLYAVNGVFFGREILLTGAWLVAVGLTSLLLPFWVAMLWIGLAGGGAFIFTAILLRRQVPQRGQLQRPRLSPS